MSFLSSWEHYLPIAILVASLASACIYAYKMRWWDAMYWLAAAILNASVIFRPR